METLQKLHVTLLTFAPLNFYHYKNLNEPRIELVVVRVEYLQIPVEFILKLVKTKHMLKEGSS